jgi:extracellular factor (EF) 3-hydroxypalmitic acid methyl ester biosynthesis protein
VQNFLQNGDPTLRAHFTLVDFHQATLDHAANGLKTATEKHPGTVICETKKANILSLISEWKRNPEGTLGGPGSFDMVYCTGLFDYFSDRVCRELYRMLVGLNAPGGMTMVCNFTHANPIKGFMRYVLDWNLIHRSPQRLRSLAPDEVDSMPWEISLSPGMVEAYVIIRK